jgi:hypothetical protein
VAMPVAELVLDLPHNLQISFTVLYTRFPYVTVGPPPYEQELEWVL